MSNTVTPLIVVNCHNTYYPVPKHEFIEYWLPLLSQHEICVDRIPKGIPQPSLLAACKRGKGYKRLKYSYNSKGGTHGKSVNRN